MIGHQSITDIIKNVGIRKVFLFLWGNPHQRKFVISLVKVVPVWTFLVSSVYRAASGRHLRGNYVGREHGSCNLFEG